ncbi:Response regulator receiver domain-containing protein [Mariniphaga anaerophila]|uniref:Sensory/regulatory protein RpfC n=1 Tax=Mariniphaga anaerophila TaxID=1484053 RepID=A0A1M5EX34_9BACT|nr:ATP-binding protein [Mariniphaga anaerophila]SHF83757.1 Response regulator receiver domain-containing protein [Mariniphaga anaerophila]
MTKKNVNRETRQAQKATIQKHEKKKADTKQAEAKIEEKKKEILLNFISETIIYLDEDGKFLNTPIHNNSILFKKFSQAETLTLQNAFQDKESAIFTRELKKCLTSGLSEFEITNEGEKSYYKVHLERVDTGKALAIIKDVTEAHLLKKELEEAKINAENALRSKSEFLANVSHEIRTPLNAILGFSQWLFENETNNQHREYINTILHSARNLLNLLNDILDLSKIESGKINVDIHPMNYQEVINDIKMVFQQKVEDKKLSLKITTDSSVPDFVLMDELRFYQIVFNLVSNAIKFTDKGHIHISAHAAKARKKNRVNLVLSVEDTGIGIKTAQQKNIFDSFTQQPGQTNKTYEGTGLGLAIVNGLLKKLNGTIKLSSKQGKGSVFTVTLFDVEVDHSDNSRVEPVRDGAAMKLAPCTIMITDDIKYNIMVLKQLIGSENVRFIEANDGTDALAKLKTEKPDLIFMDIRMPGISGFDAAELIKQDKDLNHIPVIAFTASTIKDHNTRINELFDGFLQKPVFKKDLNALLKRFLKFSYIEENIPKNTASEKQIKIQGECQNNLQNVLKESRDVFMEKWEYIKDNLIIFEIEHFKEELEKMASRYSCSPVLNYCSELDNGLKAFDIQIIKHKLGEFPDLIGKLESYNQKMIH